MAEVIEAYAVKKDNTAVKHKSLSHHIRMRLRKQLQKQVVHTQLDKDIHVSCN